MQNKSPRNCSVIMYQCVRFMARVSVPFTWAQSNCAPIIASLAPCLMFMTGNSSTPSSSCYSQFSGAAQTQAKCLCTFVDGAPTQLPFAVNQTKTLSLPSACKVQASLLSQCKVAGSPQAAPSSQTKNTSPTARPSTPAITSSGSGSKTLPAAGQNTSSAISKTNFAPFMLFIVFMVSTVSRF